MNELIAITKTNCISALGPDHATVMAKLYQGQDGLLPITVEATQAKQEQQLFGRADFAYKELLGGTGWRKVDRDALMVCLAARNMIGGVDEVVDSQERGIIFGCGFETTPREFIQAISEQNVTLVNPMTAVNLPANSVASLVAIKQQLTGVNMTLTTGFTAGLEIVHFAKLALMSQQAKIILAGAVTSYTDDVINDFANYLEPGSSSSVFHYPTGWPVIAGEGVGLLRLMTLTTARLVQEPVLAVVLGLGLSTAGVDKNNCVHAAVKEACQQAACDAKEIDAVFLSANGDQLQEQLEQQALAACLAEAIPAVAIKGAIGDCYYAGGALAAVTAVEAMRRQQLPPTVHLKPNYSAGAYRLSNYPQDCQLKKVLVLSVDRLNKASALLLGRGQES